MGYLNKIASAIIPLQQKNIWQLTEKGGDVAITTQQQRNLSTTISPMLFQRVKHDIGMWREAIVEAEQGLANMRFRVKMQRMFIDTIMNEHVEACIKKRKRMNIQKQFAIVDKTNAVYEDITPVFQKQWFSNFMSYVLDAPLYGYSLIALNDVLNGEFNQLCFLKRENVSPDRLAVLPFPYATNGVNFLADPYRQWHIWVPTPSETGASPCGYGLLYKIAKTEIMLRNNTAYNADFNEMYGQPIRKGKTSKTDEGERNTFFQSMLDMAHNGTILLDEGFDELELLEAKSAGTGFQTFDNFEKRLEAKISKVLLGHADALDSTPGKLGGDQGGDESPTQTALREVETEDAVLLEQVVNTELFPRMRELGFDLPDDATFKFQNNKERIAIREQEDKNNLATAQIAYTMKQAGLQMESDYFEERTGIPTAEVLPNNPLPPEIKNKLNQIYSKHATH